MFKLHLDLCLVTFVWLRTNEPRYLPGSSSLLCMSFCSGTPIPQLLTESSHYCTHKQGHLSNSVNPSHFKQFNKWSALLFPGQDSLCIKRNMYSTISAIFFIFFFSLSVFIHCLWRKKRSFNSADVGRYHCWDPQPQSVLDYLVQATKYCVGFKHKFIW